MEWISGPRPSGLRSGCALPAPGRTRPDPAEALRCPESPDNLHTEGTTAVPGPDPRCPGAADHAFRPFPTLGLRPRCGNGRCCTSEWKWGRITCIQTGPQPSRGRIRGARGPQTTPSGHSLRSGCAPAAGMAGVALRSGSGGIIYHSAQADGAHREPPAAFTPAAAAGHRRVRRSRLDADGTYPVLCAPCGSLRCLGHHRI